MKQHWSISLLQASTLVGLFFLSCMAVLLLGLTLYVTVEAPRRLAIETVIRSKKEVVSVRILDPQPTRIPFIHHDPSADLATNVAPWMPQDRDGNVPDWVLMSRPYGTAAVWVNGVAHRSGLEAAWRLIREAWAIWALELIGIALVLRVRSKSICRGGPGPPMSMPPETSAAGVGDVQAASVGSSTSSSSNITRSG